MVELPERGEQERISVLESQMDTVLNQLVSISSNLDDLTATLKIPQITFTPGFTGFQTVPLSLPNFVTTSPIGLGVLAFAAGAYMSPGVNTIGGPAGAKLNCNGTRTVVYRERFGMALAGGRRAITVINSDKSRCDLTVTAEAAGGAAVANAEVPGMVDRQTVAPGAAVILPAILIVGEMYIIQCPNAGESRPCIYEFRVDYLGPA